MSNVSKILILCVDIDDDVGERLGVRTPVIGREDVLKVAMDYILRYPDDSDANAIFGAIQLYDSMKTSFGENNIEVALVAGSSKGDVMANMKVLREVSDVIGKFNADGIVLVSDGPSDEAAADVIRSIRPIISIKRIVVKQTRGFEEVAVLTRYYILKALMEPQLRKYTVGLPALIILIYAAWLFIPLSIKGLVSSILLLSIGMGLLGFALNIHKPIVKFARSYEVTFFLSIVSSFLLAIYVAIDLVVLRSPLSSLISPGFTLINAMGFVLGIIVGVNAMEIYSKSRMLPYGHVVAISMVSPLFILISLAYGFINGIIQLDVILAYMLIYFAVNLVVLLTLVEVRRRRRHYA
ncbi:multidrug ABC transporter permease [Thermocladium modestius]|uniref:Multidrug ABC transporter permease n=1 Tax=Thermocladium modestius TaxID=62609 RepID=A0A830GVJ1_9CREN|nr:DUF373 family protein [Thermocladium modestius]GGP20020.1 multidrug ABC transporter permease [Thermocladium modestius]